VDLTSDTIFIDESPIKATKNAPLRWDSFSSSVHPLCSACDCRNLENWSDKVNKDEIEMNLYVIYLFD
jgi:hypothetical protein